MNDQPAKPLYRNLLRRRVTLIALGFLSYFIMGVLSANSVQFVGCEGDEYTVFFFLLIAFVFVVSLSLFAIPCIEYCRRDDATGSESGWRRGLRPVAHGVGNVLFFFAIVLMTGSADWATDRIGPDSHHETWSPMANRALDLWSIGACALEPSTECSALLSVKWVPFRTTIATRACHSLAPGTYQVCRIPLEEGVLASDRFCRADARRPYGESVCPTQVRNDYRRRFGLIVHGETN